MLGKNAELLAITSYQISKKGKFIFCLKSGQIFLIAFFLNSKNLKLYDKFMLIP